MLVRVRPSDEEVAGMHLHTCAEHDSRVLSQAKERPEDRTVIS